MSGGSSNDPAVALAREPSRPVPANGLDAFFAAVEGPTTPMLVTAVALLAPPERGRLQPAGVCRTLAARAARLPALRRQLVGAPLGLEGPRWRLRPELDVGYHLRRAALVAPGGHDELVELVGELLSHPLDLSQPPWRLWVVEGLAEGCLALVAQAHHSLVDGTAGLGIFAQLLAAPARRGGRRPPPDSSVPQPGPSAPPEGASLPGPREALGALPWLLGWPGLGGDASSGQRLAGPFRAPRAPWNGTVSSRRTVAFGALPLEVLRPAQAGGATVNDVLLASVGWALRRFLPPEQRGPGARSLTALVPVSTRPGPLDPDATPSGNAVGCAFVPLGTDQPDPAAALAAVQAATRAAVPEARALGSAFQALASLAIPALARPLVGAAASLRLFDHLPPLANLVVSGLSLPIEGLEVLGGRLQALYPLGPVPDGVGLNLTYLRSQRTVFLGASGCAHRIPWLGELLAALPEALAELSTALAGC